jgi:hypothetical protein
VKINAAALHILPYSNLMIMVRQAERCFVDAADEKNPSCGRD